MALEQRPQEKRRQPGQQKKLAWANVTRGLWSGHHSDLCDPCMLYLLLSLNATYSKRQRVAPLNDPLPASFPDSRPGCTPYMCFKATNQTDRRMTEVMISQTVPLDCACFSLCIRSFVYDSVWTFLALYSFFIWHLLNWCLNDIFSIYYHHCHSNEFLFSGTTLGMVTWAHYQLLST